MHALHILVSEYRRYNPFAGYQIPEADDRWRAAEFAADQGFTGADDLHPSCFVGAPKSKKHAEETAHWTGALEALRAPPAPLRRLQGFAITEARGRRRSEGDEDYLDPVRVHRGSQRTSKTELRGVSG